MVSNIFSKFVALTVFAFLAFAGSAFAAVSIDSFPLVTLGNLRSVTLSGSCDPAVSSSGSVSESYVSITVTDRVGAATMASVPCTASDTVRITPSDLSDSSEAAGASSDGAYAGLVPTEATQFIFSDSDPLQVPGAWSATFDLSGFAEGNLLATASQRGAHASSSSTKDAYDYVSIKSFLPVSGANVRDVSFSGSCDPAFSISGSVSESYVSIAISDVAGNFKSASVPCVASDTVGVTPPDISDSSEAAGASRDGAYVAPVPIEAPSVILSDIDPLQVPGAWSATFDLSSLDDGKLTANASQPGDSTSMLSIKDTVGPDIMGATNISLEAISSSGAAASYNLTALDLVSGAVPVTCVPASGAAFPLGSTNVTCTAMDALGNFASAAFRVVVADNTAPAISLLSPVNNSATVNTLPAFNWTSSDAVSAVTCSLYLDGSIAASGVVPESGSVYSKTTAAALAAGSHSWYVNCTDAANNTNVSAVRTLTIAAPDAPVAATPSSGGSSYNGGGSFVVFPRAEQPSPAAVPGETTAPASETTAPEVSNAPATAATPSSAPATPIIPSANNQAAGVPLTANALVSGNLTNNAQSSSTTAALFGLPGLTMGAAFVVTVLSLLVGAGGYLAIRGKKK